MSMPRPQYPSYGKRGMPHGQSQRASHVPSHSQLQRMGSLPPSQPAPMEQPAPGAGFEEPAPIPYSNHEQVVRFVREGWAKVKKDLNDPPADPDCHVRYYTETEPNPLLQDFVPFDLEELCKRRKQSAPPTASS